jgi:hypothetical protein
VPMQFYVFPALGGDDPEMLPCHRTGHVVFLVVGGMHRSYGGDVGHVVMFPASAGITGTMSEKPDPITCSLRMQV